jgi:hypothetical protein
MDSSSLKKEQRQKLAASTHRMLMFLNNLCGRMQRLHFPADDPLCVAAERARAAIQTLTDESRCPTISLQKQLAQPAPSDPSTSPTPSSGSV